jgi:hypothetical protein
MSDQFRILGVHPIDADEPVCLIEVEIEKPDGFDFGQITQFDDGRRETWQVAYDELELPAFDGKRFAFFFHYLKSDYPLLTPFGPIAIPELTPLPDHLQAIRYEAP